LNGRPVKVLWTREEDLGHVNGFHPMGVSRLTAALAPDGLPTAVRIRIAANDAVEGAHLIEYGKYKAKLAGQVLRGLHKIPYGIPNQRVEINTMKTFVPCAPWRSTGSYANVFYLESFIDELAHAAGKDPLDYRRALINAAKPEAFAENSKTDWLKIIDVAAEKSGWGKSLPKGKGMGFAIDDRKSIPARGTVIVALVATVSVSQGGQVTIERFDIVHEAGYAIVNPEAAERQLRGMMTWGLGPVLNQAITFRNGRVDQSNFHDYIPAHLVDHPKDISISFVRTDRWISGIGEEVVPLVAPAVYNAVQVAIGKRIRSIPLRDHDLRWT
jgi:isoquinoline 1-oxidoreductase beta subunit